MDHVESIHIVTLSGISKIAIEILSANFLESLLFVYDDNLSLKNSGYTGFNIVGDLSKLKGIKPRSKYFNGFGNYSVFKKRAELSEQLLNAGLIGHTVIHSSAVLSPSSIINQGSFIAANVNIGHKCAIGLDCIVFSGTTIEHESEVGSFSYVSPGVIICGKVKVSKFCYIGPGAIISAGVTIGEKSIIGAGSVILDDVPPNSIVYGSPGKVIKENNLW